MGDLPAIYDTRISEGGIRRLEDGRVEAVWQGQQLGIYPTWEEARNVFAAADSQSAAAVPSHG